MTVLEVRADLKCASPPRVQFPETRRSPPVTSVSRRFQATKTVRCGSGFPAPIAHAVAIAYCVSAYYEDEKEIAEVKKSTLKKHDNDDQ